MIQLEVQEWRQSVEETKYPFGDLCSCISNDKLVLLEGTILDAALYWPGGVAPYYMNSISVDGRQVTFTLGDAKTRVAATGSFSIAQPPAIVALTDMKGRPAGVIVSEPARLALLGGWGIGTHTFKPANAEFVAAVCFPVPDIGVTGFLLDDGSILSGDVWLIGDSGVVLRSEAITLYEKEPIFVPGGGGGGGGFLPPVFHPLSGPTSPYARKVLAIRIDFIGDPLYRRRACYASPTTYVTPQFIKKIIVQHAQGSFTCKPDHRGNMQIVSTHHIIHDPALRISTNPKPSATAKATSTRPNTPITSTVSPPVASGQAAGVHIAFYGKALLSPQPPHA